MQRYGEIRIPEIAQMGHSVYHDCGILPILFNIIRCTLVRIPKISKNANLFEISLYIRNFTLSLSEE